MIKVAMILRSTLYTSIGGDTIQAMQTARLLRDQGFYVEIKLTNEQIDYSEYSLLHFFNITRPADILFHIKKANLPFVVSTILTNYSEYDRFYRKGIAGSVLRYFHKDSIEYIKAVSRWVRGKDTMMSIPYLWKGQKKSIIEIINKAVLVMPNSVSEYKRLSRSYKSKTDYMVVPNGVDEDLFCFNSKINKDPHLVLCVARIEGIKNQLNLIKALNHTRFKLLIIGASASNQQSYYKECRDIAAPNIQFTGHLPHHHLVHYYQKAKVHILPSWFETTGLSSLEAAAMGCNVVISTRGDSSEYFNDDAVYCDPASPDSIYAAVRSASEMPLNERLRMKISSSYTWQHASMRTAEGYRKTLN
jgi:glycosyltransferase involved in cell wall biosynthesis